MTQQHQHQAPPRLYRILSILLPLGIYGCQIFGKFTILGTCVAGVLTALNPCWCHCVRPLLGAIFAMRCTSFARIPSLATR